MDSDDTSESDDVIDNSVETKKESEPESKTSIQNPNGMFEHMMKAFAQANETSNNQIADLVNLIKTQAETNASLEEKRIENSNLQLKLLTKLAKKDRQHSRKRRSSSSKSKK